MTIKSVKAVAFSEIVASLHFESLNQLPEYDPWHLPRPTNPGFTRYNAIYTVQRVRNWPGYGTDIFILTSPGLRILEHFYLCPFTYMRFIRIL